jgi:hypothetical protein
MRTRLHDCGPMPPGLVRGMSAPADRMLGKVRPRGKYGNTRRLRAPARVGTADCVLHQAGIAACSAGPVFGQAMKLSWLALVLGLLLGGAGWFGWKRPTAAVAAARRFPRSVPWGTGLMLLATVWFLYYVAQENIADFAAIKPHLMVAFGVIGIGACLFVKDYLGARGLAVLWLLLAKLMVDTGRPHLEDTSWVLVNQTLAYVLVVAGIWVTISPQRLRDWILWATATEARWRGTSLATLALGAGLVVLALTAYRGL